MLDDAALDEAMRRAGEKRIDAKRRLRARQLFALALETPGGLKVHTIHAFCTQLLHLFPFEANVAARFEVLDETKENQLLEQLSLDVMLKAAGEPDSPLGRALAQAVLAAADVTFRDLVREMIRQRDKLMRWVEAAGGVPQAMEQLSRALDIAPDETVAAGRGENFRRQPDRLVRMGRGRRRAEGRVENRQGAGRPLPRAGHAERRRADRHISGYLLHRGRDKVRDKIGTDAIQKEHPSLCQRLAAGARPRLDAGAAQARRSRRATAASRCSPSRMP